MDFIRITRENLDKEHICCAISGNGDCQVQSKKTWLAERLEEGLVFLKADARGKCFIEYLPGESAWAPVEADGLTWIDCLWVSGQLAGHGYAGRLLEECIRDSREQGRHGIAVLSADKKRPYLSDPKFLSHKGFQAADQSGYFRLYWLPLDASAQPPRFRESVRKPPKENGLVLYYTRQCPFTAKYAPLGEKLAAERGISLRTVRLETGEQAQAAPSPFTTYSLFGNGTFLTHEILSEKKWDSLLTELDRGGI